LLLLLATAAIGQENWLNLRTKHFNIVGNVSERDCGVLADKLEMFHETISRIFNADFTSLVPVTVVAFKSDASFMPYKPVYKGRLEDNTAGYFLGGEDQNLIALNLYADYQRPLTVIFHEYTHLLTDRGAAELPAWLSEGIAEFYSTFRVEKKDVSIGIPIRHHVLLLRNQPLIPLPELFAIDRRSSAFHERDKQGIFYAESWALVHYLMMGDKSSHEVQLGEFIKLLESGEATDAAFTKAFNTTYADLEKALRRYVGKDTYPGITYTLESSVQKTQVVARAIGEAEARCYLGDLLLRLGREKEAEDFFKQAAASDPKLSRAYEGMGSVAVHRTNYEAAKSLFRRAIELDQANHIAHYQYAAALWETGKSGSSLSSSLSGVAEEVRSEARKAARLVPGYIKPYVLLTTVSLATGEGLDEALVAISNALKLEPQRKAFRLRLGEVQMRLKEVDAARKTLEPLINDAAEPDLQKSARAILDSTGPGSTGAPATPGQRRVLDDQQSVEKIEAQAGQAIKSGEYDKAIGSYRRLLRSNETEAHLGLSLAYLKLRDYRASLEHARMAILKEPRSARGHALAGRSLLRSGDFAQAVAEITRALDLNSKDPIAVSASAEIDFYEGRLAQARAKASAAQSLGDDDPDTWLTIARIDARTDSFDGARAAYEQFLKASPNSEGRGLNNGVREFYGKLATLKAYQMAGPNSTQLPFKIGPDRRPYVKVRVNGVEATFIVGTGSALSVISTQLAGRLNMPVIEQGRTAGAGSQSFQIQYSVVDSLELRDLKISSVPCVLRSFEEYKNVKDLKPPDGVLGLSLLSHFVFQLDYKDNAFRLERNPGPLSSGLASAGAKVIPFRTTANGLLSIEVRLDGGRIVNALLDSGTSTNIVSRADVDSFKSGDVINSGRTTRVVGPGAEQHVEGVALRNCLIGDLKPRDIRALMLDFAQLNRGAGFDQTVGLGGEFLRDFRVTIDQGGGRLSLQPYRDE
jgi:tetratricopeptide (TPR) repeat protein/predicted aspartyl protease